MAKNNISVMLRITKATKDLLDTEALKRGYTLSRVAENHILKSMNNEKLFSELVVFLNDNADMNVLQALDAFDAYINGDDEDNAVTNSN